MWMNPPQAQATSTYIRTSQNASSSANMLTITCHLIILALLCLCLHRHQSSAFQQPSPLAASPSRRYSTSRDHDVSAARLDEDQPHDDCNNDDSHDDCSISRRDILSRTLYGVGLTLAGSAERGNALDVPNFLVSSEGDRGVKGMPVPSKNLGGFSNKIRSVSKIMVRVEDGVRRLFRHFMHKNQLIHLYALPLCIYRMNSKGT